MIDQLIALFILLILMFPVAFAGACWQAGATIPAAIIYVSASIGWLMIASSLNENKT